MGRRTYVSSSSSSGAEVVGGAIGCLVLLFLAFLWGIAAFAVSVAVSAVALFFVWNWIVPDVFIGIVRAGFIPAQISLLQAVGLVLLFGLLFGGGSLIRFGRAKSSDS